MLAPAAAASALTIDSSGPLVRIDISETLNCAVNHAGDVAGEFYRDTACGTFVAVDDEIYGPDYIPAGSVFQTSWTPVAQSSGGSGTAADPYAIVTDVVGGDLSVRQTDTYVTGDHHYDSESVVTNNGDEDVEVTFYRAADCYLGDDDHGFGAYDAATGAVSCVAPDSQGQPSAASRIEQFIPITEGSRYLYSQYADLWRMVASKQPLPNEIRRAENLIDNAIGLSWTVTIPAGGSTPFVAQTNFSPLDVATLSTSLAVDPASVLVGDQATVTARVENPNDIAQDLSDATITLPEGVAYVTGSTTGIAEPVLDDGQLVFDGVGAEITANGALEFTFKVTSATVGTYTIDLAAAVESRVDVTPSSAQLVVQTEIFELPTLLSFDPETVTVGDRSTLAGSVINEYGADFTVDELLVTLPEGASYVAGSAEGITDPVVDGTTLTFAGPILVEAGGTFPFSLQVATAQAGEQTFTLEGTSADADVLDSHATLTVEAAVVPPTPTEEEPTAPTGELASTGVDTSQLLALSVVGGVLLLGSAVALGIAARRRHAAE